MGFCLKKKSNPAKKHKPYPESKVISDEMLVKEENLDEIWTTVEGQHIHIKNLRGKHIVKILEIMNNAPHWRHEQRPFLEQELKRRAQRRLVRKTKAGKLFYVD